jgi:SAM-dependent methyltransferase
MNYLLKFPKKRPSLSSFYQKIFDSEYILNRSGKRFILGKIVSRLESWMHYMIARSPSNNILELGAGTLNHLAFEKKYINYDVIEPQKKLINYSIVKKYKVRSIYSRINNIPKKIKYDKIISIAVLEHLTDLPLEVCLAIKHLKHRGIFLAGIPCEGKFLWGISWRITSAISFYFRTGKSYKPLLRYEHINSHKEIIDILKFFFKEVKISSFPLPFYHLAFYSVLECKKPKDSVVNKYLRLRNI